MVLRCECGGAVELISEADMGDAYAENYQCAECGSLGSYTFNESGDASTGGCVVIA